MVRFVKRHIIVNSINTNFNNNYGLDQRQIRFKAEPQAVAQEVQLPDMYYMPDYANRPKSFKETVKKYDLMGLVYQWLEHPFMMLGTCLGISVGVDAFDRSCNKEYSKSILGKAARFGDKIENSSFVQNETTQKVLSGIKKGWENTTTFLKKNSVIRAMIETPTRPENSMPLDELKHTEARVVGKFKELAKKYDILGKEKEGETLLSGFKNVKNMFHSEEAEYKEILKSLGRTDAEIETILKSAEPKKAVGAELKKALGLSDSTLEKIMKDETGKTASVVKNACANVKDVKGFGEIHNRLNSILKKSGAETKTGRFMSRFLQKIHRGFTFGGSKYGVMLFVAPMLVETMLNTKKADNKEKVGTFADGLIRAVSWVFTFPLILKGIHALGGIQYSGMGKEKVERLRKEIEKFNARVEAKEFGTKDAYNQARKGLELRMKALKRVKNQSLLTRMLRNVSAFTKADLNAIKPYNNGSGFGNFARKAGHNMKSFAYSVGRVGVFMMVGIPLVDKVIEKCTSAVFGKPYDAMKEEEYAEQKKVQEEYTMNDLKDRMLEVQKNKAGVNNGVNQGVNSGLTPENEAVMAEIAAAAAAEQAAKKTVEEQQAKPQEQVQPQKTEKQEPTQQTAQTQKVVQTQTVKRDNYTYIPSSENVLNANTPNIQINKYIPSQIGAKFTKTFDNSGLDAALKRANNAEKRALEVLSGNFNTRY